MNEIEALCNDLEKIIALKSIPLTALEDVKAELKSKDVVEYLDTIVSKAKPEESLKYNFFYKDAPILRLLGLKGTPEVNVGSGFVDLVLKDVIGRKVLIEFKRLFEVRRNKLIRNDLDYKEHEDQIKKYIFSESARFVVLTNLAEWYFFSSKTAIKKFEPFYQASFKELVEDLNKYGDFYSLLERKEHSIERKELDEKFFESLKEWVGLLSKVKFNVDEKEKNSLILHLLNKLIFIQTLDDYGVIEFNWLYKTWNAYSRYIAIAESHRSNPKVAGKNYKTFLQKFLSEINDFFYTLYDTELFKDDFIKKVKDDPKNWKTLYENLAIVLGFKEWQKIFGLGLTQYDYSQIDEDILGKAYETYLAEQRKEKGIYYTPKYITQFIVEETLKKKLDVLKEEILISIKNQDFERVKEKIEELFNIKVIDLACGSGSFLIKALRALWDIYKDIRRAINEVENKNVKSNNLEVFLNSTVPASLKGLFPKDERTLMAQIVLRHIFAIDLDANALEVAKMNIWRELVRLNPKAFHWEKLGESEHVLPNLSLNFRAGDSLLGFDDPEVLSEFKGQIKELWELWEEFLKNPEDPTPLDRIEEVKAEIRKILDDRYKQILAKNGFDVEKLAERGFVHYPLEFFMVFFNKDGAIKGGFDVIIGNPPYVRIQNLKKESKEYVDFLNEFYETAHKNYDLALPFIERGYRLLKKTGELGFIVTKKWMKADYGEKLRDLLARERAVRLIVDFGDNQVFKGATTYTMILILEKAEKDKLRYAYVEELKESVEQLRAVHDVEKAEKENIQVVDVPFEELSKDVWVILTEEEKAIVKKIYKGSKRLEDEDVTEHIFVGVQTSADKVYHLTKLGEENEYYIVMSNTTGRTYRIEKGILRPLVSGENVGRFIVKFYEKVILFPYEVTDSGYRLLTEDEIREKYPNAWEYLLENKKLLESREEGKIAKNHGWYAFGRLQNIDKQHLRKLMVPRLVTDLRVAYDSDGQFCLDNVDVNGITLRKNVSYLYVLALLNSSLLNYVFKKKSVEFASGYYSANKQFIKDLPIKLPQTPEEKKLAENIKTVTENIIKLLKVHYKIKSLWQEWSEKLSSDKLTLRKLIDHWKMGIGRISLENLFIANIEFKSKEKTEFDEFDIAVEGRTLKILGRECDTFYTAVEIEASSEEIAEHLYFSIMSLIESKKKVNTIEDLLSKTEVPTIRKSPQETIRIIDQVKSSVKVDSLIAPLKLVKEYEAYLDALVFKLYGLTNDEAKFVLKKLKASENYISSVLNKLSALDTPTSNDCS